MRHVDEAGKKEREEISKQIKMSFQKAPAKVQASIQMSSQLRDAFMKARQTGTLETFKQQRSRILGQALTPNTISAEERKRIRDQAQANITYINSVLANLWG